MMKCPNCGKDTLDVDITDESKPWKIYCKDCGETWVREKNIPRGRCVVVVSGGMVQEVYRDAVFGGQVTVVDYDTDGVNEGECELDSDGNPFVPGDYFAAEMPLIEGSNW